MNWESNSRLSLKMEIFYKLSYKDTVGSKRPHRKSGFFFFGFGFFVLFCFKLEIKRNFYNLEIFETSFCTISMVPKGLKVGFMEQKWNRIFLMFSLVYNNL